MHQPNTSVKELVEKMKDTARAHASIPVLPPPRECYHEFASGLKLCLTVDVLTAEWIKQIGQLVGVKAPPAMAQGTKYWHLSIARVGAAAPMPEEVAHWRRAFFDEPPYIETGGMLPRVHSQHFFWKYE